MKIADLTDRIPQLGASGPRRLALTEVAGNLTFTANTVTAWFTLDDKVWPFQPDDEREQDLATIAAQYAGLAGHPIHLRRTSRPFPAARWAANMTSHATPLPDVAVPSPRSGVNLPRGPRPTAPTWRQHAFAMEEHLRYGDYRLGRTHLGVTFARPMRINLPGRKSTGVTDALAKRIENVTAALAAPGMAAQPTTPEELLWLIYRSVGLGHNPPTHRPGSVGPDDIDEFLDAIDMVRGPYASTTQIVDRRTGQVRHVAVLTVGRMEPLTIPQVHQPWLHLAQQVGFEVEVSSRVNILGPAATRGSIGRQLRIVNFQQRDYAEHNLPEPPELSRLIDRARRVGDEIDTGLPVDACRAHGFHRFAVSADTQAECLEQVRELVGLYERELHITLTHPKAQVALAREFVPGEPLAKTGYVRRMPVRLLAAAVPQATGAVGDDRGDLIGETVGADRRPVFLDLHYPMEVREGSGLAVLVAAPGGGKSTLMGALGYLAARRGVQVTLLDPSGPLSRLCALPELRPYSRVVNLVGAERGTLAPYAMIPTPRREDYPAGRAGDDAYAADVANARADRKELVLDIATMLLRPATVRSDEKMEALQTAIRAVPATDDATLDDVIRALEFVGNHESSVAAKSVAGQLSDVAELPYARLFFGTPPPGTLGTDVPFTVITMTGLRLPNLAVDREEWSTQERIAVPMLYLGYQLAVRRCYGGPMKRRKFVGLDEAHFMADWPSARAFSIRLARDSRKWNIAALVASQNPKDVLRLDVQNLVSTTFVGRIAKNPKVAAGALEMLDLPAGAGYEPTLAGLSRQLDTTSDDRLGYREFVIRDVDDRIQKVRVDFSYLPKLLTALDTTPGGTE